MTQTNPPPLAATALAQVYALLDSEDPSIQRFKSTIKDALLGSWVDMVRAFHTMYDAPVMNPMHATREVSHMSPDRLAMRIGLILEEAQELIEACGFTVKMKHGRFILIPLDEPADIIEIADGLGDLIFVCIGFALECGIDLHKVIREISASNFTKLGEDGNPIYREDGKVLKGPNFVKPALARVIMTGYQAELRFDDSQAKEAEVPVEPVKPKDKFGLGKK